MLLTITELLKASENGRSQGLTFRDQQTLEWHQHIAFGRQPRIQPIVTNSQQSRSKQIDHV